MSDHAVVYTHEILTHRCVFERHSDTFFLKVPSRVIDVLESVFIDTIPRCATGIAHQSISFLTVVLLVAEINSFCIELFVYSRFSYLYALYFTDSMD